jgi:cysteine desulfurase
MVSAYLDNNSTTPIDPRVLEAMVEQLRCSPANPSSAHRFGRAARQALREARQQIASYLGVEAEEVTFTSGATESLGTLLLSLGRGGHIITSQIEHPAILQTAQYMEKQGSRVTYLPVGSVGAIDLEQLEEAIAEDTRLIILGAANSETGVKNPTQEIAQVAERYGIAFVVDGVGLFGREQVELVPGITAFVVAGHKIHGPPGIGMTWAKKSYEPLLRGGSQEFKRRAGTENLPGIVGLAKAITLLAEELPSATERMRELRDHFEQELTRALPSLRINGTGPRAPHVSNITFPDADGETLLLQLDQAGIAASLGSACTSGALEPSHVLRAMGVPYSLARSSIRFSFSRLTTREEVEYCIQVLVSICSVVI